MCFIWGLSFWFALFHFCAYSAQQRGPNSSLRLGARSFQRVPSFPLVCLLAKGNTQMLRPGPRLLYFSNCPGKFSGSDTESILGRHQSHYYNLPFILYFLLFESTLDDGGISSRVFPGPNTWAFALPFCFFIGFSDQSDRRMTGELGDFTSFPPLEQVEGMELVSSAGGRQKDSEWKHQSRHFFTFLKLHENSI